MRLIRYLLFAFSLLIPLACIRFSLIEGGVPTQITPTAFPSPARTLLPSPSPTPFSTPTPISTETPTPALPLATEVAPTSTATLPITTQFDQVRIVSLSFMEFDQFMVTLQTPSQITGEYSATLNDVPFECLLLPPHPNLLYCIGPKPPYDTIANFKLYPKGIAQPIYETDIHVPLEPLPTLTPRSRQGNHP